MATCPSCHTQHPEGTATCPNDGATLLPDSAFNAEADLVAGQVVGEYRIEGKLGAGGFGAVYRAVHPVIGKAAAIKVLNRQYSSNPQMVSRFIAEARAVNQIRHRNIIDIFSFGKLDDGRQYYVMELLDGTTFDKYIAQKKRLAVEEAVTVLRGIARAIDAAHAAGIAHRDLKPENIFLMFDEDSGVFPKLLDFGIAKLLGDSISGHKTRTGAPMGTPYYMSPEQCRGKNVDHRTDIYSFGVMTHLVLTGKLPFEGDDVMDLLIKQTSAPPPRMSEIATDLPPTLDAPVLQMLEKDPAKRPETLMAALDALAFAAKEAGYGVELSKKAISTGGGASATGPAIITPPKPAGALAEARTVASTDGASRTLGTSSSDVQPQKSRTPLIAAIAVGVVAVSAGVTIFLRSKHDEGQTHGATTASVVTAEAKAQAPATSTVTVAPSSDAPPPLPADKPAEVEITITSEPAVVDVYVDKIKIGTSEKPIKIKRAEGKTKLSFQAKGYVTEDMDVSLASNLGLQIKLKKAAGPAVVKKNGGKGELEF